MASGGVDSREPTESAAAELPDAAELSAARALIASADRVVILTGAGLSADSGLSTFRDPGGHWESHRPEELATPQAFARDPCLVWGWYDTRRRAVVDAAPNAAHHAIAAFVGRRDGVTLVTQNVDGLHSMAAGEASPLPLELHGTLFRTRCTDCGRRRPDREPIDTSSPETLPRCRDCSGLLRPDVVWFGESLGDAIERAFDAAARARVCLVVGTSAVVQPAASVALATRGAGGDIIEVNPEGTPLTPLCTASFRATAVQAVPALLAS